MFEAEVIRGGHSEQTGTNVRFAPGCTSTPDIWSNPSATRSRGVSPSLGLPTPPCTGITICPDTTRTSR